MKKRYVTERKELCSWLMMIGVLVMVWLMGHTPQLKAADYPDKAITVIVPFGAGGGTDMLARLFSDRLGKTWGVPVTVVNKPGGMAIPGTLEALQAAPDGYTILTDSSGTSSLLDAWGKNVPFDIKDRTYLVRVVVQPHIFIARADSGWEKLDDVAAAISKNPSNIRWGWLGGTVGTDVPVHQFMSALVAKGITDATQIKKVKMVTYTGGRDTGPAVAGGHVDVVVGSPSTASIVSTGKVRLIAVGNTKRCSLYPELPTTIEQGWPSVQGTVWYGFSGPKGMPPNIVQTWVNTVQLVVSDPAFASKIERIGSSLTFLGGEDFRKFVLNEAKEIKTLPAIIGVR